MIYYCKICEKLDEEGISGHATNRCATNLGATNNVSISNRADAKGRGKASHKVSERARSNKSNEKVLQRPPSEKKLSIAGNPNKREAKLCGARIYKDVQESQGSVPGKEDSVQIPRTLNRRSREAYNAYQRDYMRKYRAAKEKQV